MVDNSSGTQSGILPSLSYTSLRDGAYKAIRDAIIEGKLKAGQRLLENDLGRELGISRAPVREALRELEREGLVESIPHRGTYVAQFTAEDAREVYSLRAALETLAIRLCMQHMAPEQLNQLEALVKQMEKAADSGNIPQMVDADFSFHETLCRAAGHRRLLEMWLGMRCQIRAFVSVTAMQYLAPTEIVERHRLVLDTLRTNDVEQAAKILSKDILEVGEHVAAGLERGAGNAGSGTEGGVQ